MSDVRRWCALYVTFYTGMVAVDLLIGHRANYVASFAVSFNFASVITALWPRRALPQSEEKPRQPVPGFYGPDQGLAPEGR